MSNRAIIVDYGAGNLRSVFRAVEHAGVEPVVTDDPALIETAEAVILPGVGAAADTMCNLEAHHIVQPLREYIDSGRPFLGVCMGLQALFDTSDEGDQRCLGVLPGRVVKFDEGLKVPHMGWNRVALARPDDPLYAGIADGSYFYFLHSFYPVPADESVVSGWTEYGVRFAAALQRDRLVATQFHPEKSGAAGLKLYENFLACAGLEVRGGASAGALA